ncbi:cyanate lyase [Microbacterium sp. 1154]|uniref:helix-turn-helix domain-containing protein n=1 Tax=Microbacterium sp. 1154 TaxID=2817733 RepID=UPI00286634F7|nr:helix-turn-helix transcriptional regulator [Microbacterium sp. 1154]MDR6691378.1 cyanate lyase [Microbacterium sp. 1154]
MDNETPDAYTRAVARILTDAKKKSGKSFTALATDTGLGRATVVRLLAGERDINIGYLRALSAALDLDAATVLNDADKHV